MTVNRASVYFPVQSGNEPRGTQREGKKTRKTQKVHLINRDECNWSTGFIPNIGTGYVQVQEPGIPASSQKLS